MIRGTTPTHTFTFDNLDPGVEYLITVKNDEKTFVKSSYITLTEEGLKVASKTYEKHRLLTDLFISIGVNKEIAEKDACRVEHTLSEETFEAIKKSIKK